MRVVVTGGAGRLGRHVIAELQRHGHEVICVDKRLPDGPLGGVRAHIADLTDLGQVYGVLRGADAVIHLGAIPSAGTYPNEVVFANNVLSHYHVLEAAAALGIRRLVTASTVQVLAQVGAVRPIFPHYVPVDEEHPVYPQNPYSLSKQLGEEMNTMFHRRYGLQALSLRFCWIADVEAIRARNPGQGGDPIHLWSYVDVRDAAQCCRLGVEADGLGAEVFYVAAADTLRDEPTVELIRRHFPDMEVRPGLQGYQTAISIDKARRLLGYQPQYSWRG